MAGHGSATAADPWRVDESDFPRYGQAAEKLRFLLRYAVLAPSGHNTQPWRFVIEGESVLLYADRERRLPVADPDDRELTMSCGAALAQLLVAIHHFGLTAEVEELPRLLDPDLLAASGWDP